MIIGFGNQLFFITIIPGNNGIKWLKKYINNWRMVKAKYLLKNSKLSIMQIGEKIGYHSKTSFNRAFKNQFAISPGKYRNCQIKTIGI